MSNDGDALSLPPSLFGNTYPLGSVTGMVPTAAAAQAAKTELLAVGVAEDDIRGGSGQDLLQIEQTRHRRQGVGDRLLSHFPSEEARIVKEYTELAAAGYAVVAVQVPEADHTRRNQVAAMLHRHGAKDVHYWGGNTVTDL